MIQAHTINGYTLLSREGRCDLLRPGDSKVVFTSNNQNEAVAVSHALNVITGLLKSSSDADAVATLLVTTVTDEMNARTPAPAAAPVPAAAAGTAVAG